MVNSFFYRILQAAQEPSSWAGIAAMLGSIGLFGLSGDIWSQIASAVMAAAGALALVLKEKSNK